METIKDVLGNEMQEGLLVKLFLKRDVKPVYNHKGEVINIRSVENLYFGIQQHILEGIFIGLDDPFGEVVLEFVDHNGYEFSIRDYQIDYKVII